MLRSIYKIASDIIYLLIKYLLILIQFNTLKNNFKRYPMYSLSKFAPLLVLL